MSSYVGNNMGTAGCIGALRGICIGGYTSVNSDTTAGVHYHTGVERSNTEGFPTPPSISLLWPTFWRFRWGVKAGTRTLKMYVKQVLNGDPRPSVKVIANPEIGLNADLEVFAGSSTDWTPITVSFTATADGGVWVEMHNNYGSFADPAYFDHITRI